MVPDTLCKEYLRCWIHRPAKVITLLLIMSSSAKGRENTFLEVFFNSADVIGFV